jgi:hypothetical protein
MPNRSSLVTGSRAEEAYGLIHEGCRGGVLNICVFREDEQVVLSAWRKIGHFPPPHPQIVEESLTEADWITLTRLVRRAHFWALPKKYFPGGLDGWTWTIEGRKGKRYNSCESWCASVSTGFEELGNFLVDLSGLQVPDDVP